MAGGLRLKFLQLMHQYLIQPGTENWVLMVFSFSKILSSKGACKTLLSGSDVAITAPRSNQVFISPSLSHISMEEKIGILNI